MAIGGISRGPIGHELSTHSQNKICRTRIRGGQTPSRPPSCRLTGHQAGGFHGGGRRHHFRVCGAAHHCTHSAQQEQRGQTGMGVVTGQTQTHTVVLEGSRGPLRRLETRKYLYVTFKGRARAATLVEER